MQNAPQPLPRLGTDGPPTHSSVADAATAGNQTQPLPRLDRGGAEQRERELFGVGFFLYTTHENAVTIALLLRLGSYAVFCRRTDSSQGPPTPGEGGSTGGSGTTADADQRYRRR